MRNFDRTGARTAAGRRLVKGLCLGVLSIGVALAAPALAAQLVVIESSGSTLSAGAVVDSETRFALEAGAAVTLVARDGKVFVLTGPFEGTAGGLAGGGNASLSGTITRLLEAGRQDTTSLGTTRGAGGEPGAAAAPPSYRLINALAGGDQCLFEPAEATLWRQGGTPAASLSLQSEAGGASLAWPVGEATLAWPDKVAITDGASYAVNLGGKAARFVLHTAPDGLASTAHRAAWLTAKACLWQSEILLQAVAAPAEAGGDEAEPDAGASDRRSQIIESEGHAYLGEDTTLRQMRAAALENAKSIALESSETYLRKLSRVKDFELQYAVVESATEGGVRVLNFKDMGVQPDNRYKVWIRAEVLYRSIDESRLAAALNAENAAGDRPREATAETAAPLTVKVWTEKDRYAEGEKMKILLRGNKDFYANVYYRMADGTLVRILPNKYRKLHHFDGGTTYVVPSDEDRFDLTVTPPFGTETISVHASTKPIEDTGGAEIGGGIYVKEGTLASISAEARGKRRGIDVTGREAAVEEFYDARWQVATDN